LPFVSGNGGTTQNRASFLVLSLVAAVAEGCGGSENETPSQDAGPDLDGGGFEPDPPAAPAAPAPPALTPCPSGWREIVDEAHPDIVTCDPWPEGGPHVCAAGEAHFPGRPGCESVGTACPAGDFAEDIPAGATVLYVRAGAPAGGDGSAASPFAAIGEALAVAPDDAVLALSKGTFDEVVTVRVPVTLLGACVEETILASSVPSFDDATLTFSGRGGATVRNLRVSGARRGLLVHAAVGIESVVVVSSSGVGIGIYEGGDAEATDVVVRDTQPTAAGGFGVGVDVAAGGRLSLARGVLERNRTNALVAWDPGTSVEATDLGVVDTLPQQSDGGFGYGIAAYAGATVEIVRGAISGSRSRAIEAWDPGTFVSAHDLVVRDTLADGTGSLGHGADVAFGAELDLDRCLVERSRAAGILAASRGDEGSRATLVATDLVVRDTRPDEASASAGFGVLATESASVDLDRVALLSSSTVGLEADATGTDVVATDLIVRDTRPTPGAGGEGVSVYDGARVYVTRGSFESNESSGVLVAGEGTVFAGTDLCVADTLPDASGLGVGVTVIDGARTTLLRVLLERNAAAGIFLPLGPCELDATDLAVRDTEPGLDGAFGNGIFVGDAGRVSILRAAFSGNRGVGVEAFGIGAHITLEHTVVDRTLEEACAVDGCSADGIGIAAIEGGAVEATSFRVSESALCGVQVASDGAIDLHGGEVSHNPIGANVQSAGFDVERLQDGVLFLDNEVDLDTAVLPVPEPVIDPT